MQTIVLDSNILFAALIKDSVTRKIIIEYEGTLLFPEYIWTEFKNHEQEIFDKTKLSQEEFDLLIHTLLSKVTLVPNQSLAHVYTKSVLLSRHIDPDDILFIACVLAHPGSVLWSSDKRLKKIPMEIWNTAEMIHYLEKTD